jgi:CheY-like chemotaxis protein
MKKIFIADDDPDILEILSLMLKTAGYEIHASSNANDIFTYKNNLPDLILLDIWMSGIDGRETCRRLKENEITKNIPVIFLSGNAGINEITKEYQARDFIAKPFEMDHLLNKIHDILSETTV